MIVYKKYLIFLFMLISGNLIYATPSTSYNEAYIFFNSINSDIVIEIKSKTNEINLSGINGFLNYNDSWAEVYLGVFLEKESGILTELGSGHIFSLDYNETIFHELSYYEKFISVVESFIVKSTSGKVLMTLKDLKEEDFKKILPPSDIVLVSIRDCSENR
ncbi:MAG: hypothetical protein JEY91_09505 [Spirochaetaceae bacterium]|nr:hypothetical protein [Spirochaetaceae bacterium]